MTKVYGSKNMSKGSPKSFIRMVCVKPLTSREWRTRARSYKFQEVSGRKRFASFGVIANWQHATHFLFITMRWAPEQAVRQSNSWKTNADRYIYDPRAPSSGPQKYWPATFVGNSQLRETRSPIEKPRLHRARKKKTSKNGQNIFRGTRNF